jgi:DNA-binding response OmpR family regulator
MSVKYPMILYVGEMAQGQALAQTVARQGWHVFAADDTLGALGLYITYVPDIIVIDAAARPLLATEVFHHLRSVEARPLLVLVDERQRKNWGRGDGAAHIRPHSDDPQALTRRIEQILHAEAVLSQRL